APRRRVAPLAARGDLTTTALRSRHRQGRRPNRRVGCCLVLSYAFHMAPPVQYATTPDGVGIAYWTVGSGSPLIFMPEPVLTAAAPEFELPSPMQWYERLSRHRRVIRFDHRGTGMSSQNANDFSLAAFELDLATIVEATGNG